MKHHHYLGEELPKLSPYVTKVMKVHGPGQPHLVRLHQLFNELKTELEQHTLKEDNVVFPLIIKLEQGIPKDEKDNIEAKIKILEKDHDHAGLSIIKELREITNDYTLPEHACGTYRLVYQRLEALESDLFQHIKTTFFSRKL
jgi:regulator of cell morphogenesis and NO signaling